MKDLILFGYHIKITKRHKKKTKEERMNAWIKKNAQGQMPLIIEGGKEQKDEQAP